MIVKYMQNKLIIWWSTWDFYRVTSIKNTDEVISQYFAVQEANALEIMFHFKENLECQITKEVIQNNFYHCCIHAPVHAYQNDEQSNKILKIINNIHHALHTKNIVVHPDAVIDWSVFEQYDKLPFSIENMDNEKKLYESIDDIGKILKKYPNRWFTLDLQHCFVNDPSMQLADDFHRTFWNRIVEYHISWYRPDYIHYPLFKTKQNNIIQALQKKDIPIIIESTFDEKSDLKKEIEYVQNLIK